VVRHEEEKRMSQKTWFITGTSRGFGREWAIAALDRGDQVVATAREVNTLNDLKDQYGDLLLPLALDVTDHNRVFEVVQQGHDHFGRLDVVVNNAGYGQFGMIEEISEAEAREQINTNVFGAFWVTQAALPLLREQGGGHIIQVSSIGGISAFANIGMYHASKWALEGFSQALAREVADFGIKVTIIEPGGFATDWGGSSAKHAVPLAAYEAQHEASAEMRRTRQSVPGDPLATREAILKIVDAANPPLRIFFGDGPLAIAEADYASRLALWKEWEPVSIAAGGNQ
jgi:NAD(P)-dependent dehydrogenase (short-subunit alcohol dehydrogenase family)